MTTCPREKTRIKLLMHGFNAWQARERARGLHVTLIFFITEPTTYYIHASTRLQFKDDGYRKAVIQRLAKQNYGNVKKFIESLATVGGAGVSYFPSSWPVIWLNPKVLVRDVAQSQNESHIIDHNQPDSISKNFMKAIQSGGQNIGFSYFTPLEVESLQSVKVTDETRFIIPRDKFHEVMERLTMGGAFVMKSPNGGDLHFIIE